MQMLQAQSPARPHRAWGKSKKLRPFVSGQNIAYDAFGNAITNDDRNGNRTTTYFDVKGRRTAQVDALGYLIEFDYDAQDNLLEQRVYSVPLNPASVSPSSKPAAPLGEVYVTTRRYDAASRVVEENAPQIQVFDPATQTSSFVRPTTALYGVRNSHFFPHFPHFFEGKSVF
jgi:YD repeat-containing protein